MTIQPAAEPLTPQKSNQAPRKNKPPRAGTRAKLVADMLRQAGWGPDQVTRNFPLADLPEPPGRRRQRHHGAREDLAAYVLWAQPGVPTAVVGTVGAQHDPRLALPRASRQAQRLDTSLAYATNGQEIVERFGASGRIAEVAELGSPARAWRVFTRTHGLRGHSAELLGQRYDPEALIKAGGASPEAPAPPLRYYQLVAVNRALMAWLRSEGRALLRLAAGAGATVTATAIVAKLLTYRLTRRVGEPFGVLYLDDRPSASTGLGALGTVARWGETGEVWLATRSLGAALDDLPSHAPDLVVVNLAHGGSALDPALWTDPLSRFDKAFRLGLVDAEAGPDSPVRHWFGAITYRHTPAQAMAEGYLPTPRSTPTPEEAAPEEVDLDPEELSRRLNQARLTDPDHVRKIMAHAQAWHDAQRAATAPSPAGPARRSTTPHVRPRPAGGPGPDLSPDEARRLAEYRELARDRRVFAAELLALYRLANYPGSLGQAARSRAAWLQELEALAEVQDRAGGERAVVKHIRLLRAILR
ncbi:MAG: hypothetical protein LBD90_06055 [Bifidobacteriaceae bacterium]|jgi:hypothetical protein|nr:hypothetical protein [Bifidobacteriaceae bacterium]